MSKVMAMACVLGWSAFWAFGYLALTAPVTEVSQIITAALLAFAGLITGSFSYMVLKRTPSTELLSAR